MSLPGLFLIVSDIRASLISFRIPNSARSQIMSNETNLSRRQLFAKMGILFDALVGLALAAPIVGFLLSSIMHWSSNDYTAWVPLGPANDFPEGETRLATFRNPYVTPTDGKTAETACWVRRVGAGKFQVFAINCMHLGCPSAG